MRNNKSLFYRQQVRQDEEEKKDEDYENGDVNSSRTLLVPHISINYGVDQHLDSKESDPRLQPQPSFAFKAPDNHSASRITISD